MQLHSACKCYKKFHRFPGIARNCKQYFYSTELSEDYQNQVGFNSSIFYQFVYEAPTDLEKREYKEISCYSEYERSFYYIVLPISFEKAVELQLSNTRQLNEHTLETTLTYGEDVFGDNYTWLSVAYFW